ncbi:MAG: glycosyltransferase family 4 protein [Patescibacteria group bacterium]
MNVLAITGDRTFKEGNPRFDLQASAGEHLEALYWGPGALWAIPRGVSYDVVSTQDPFLRGMVGLFWARRFKAKFNVQVHADIAAQSWLKKMIARFVLRRATSVRVVSEKVKAQVESLGVSTPIFVLPIFVDSERFERVRRTPDSHPLVLWVGRFENEKDPLLALRVFKEVRTRVPDATLVMLGNGSLASVLRLEAQGLPVEFLGWQDTAPYLARAHVVLSTSRAESWGASIVEALAAGVPVVAPDVGVAKEAGAIVVSRERLSDAVVEVLTTHPSATLRFPLLSRQEWINVWKQSLG